jgi:secondary thiamine-phosphate synthase enzyme
MTKSSTVTARGTPVKPVSASAGGMIVRGETLVVSTSDRIELVDLTARVMDLVKDAAVREGVVSLWSMHTTCALFINEFQSALVDDLRNLIERLVPERAGYRHDDPRYSDCERGNASAHLRAALLGRSIAVGLNNGELTLGRFQSVIFAELDGPRKREITVQVMGE